MTHPPSPYQSTPAKNVPPAYQSNHATNAPSTYQFAPAIKAPPAYESTPATNAPSAYQSNPATNAPLTYQFALTHPSSPYQFAPTQPYHQAPTINHSPIYESSPTSQPTRSREHGKNKCFWEESETELLIEVLQDMASDPSRKTDGCFRSNYLNDVEKKIACKRQWYDNYSERHKEAKGRWDVPFPYFNQLELVYGRDRATGVVAEVLKMRSTT
nr:hypothetical protein [Tanacetum cinerariifolium]